MSIITYQVGQIFSETIVNIVDVSKKLAHLVNEIRTRVGSIENWSVGPNLS